MDKLLLNDILKVLAQPSCETNPWISGISVNSRLVQSGDLFIARPGAEQFIPQAIAAGAAAIMCSRMPEDDVVVPVVLVAEPQLSLIAILNAFYGDAIESMDIIAITGTNGKTSCAHFITQALSRNIRSAMIGTLGYGELNDICYTGYTTPDVAEVYRILAGFAKQGIHNAVMEVSSHALEQGRVEGLAFRAVVFTNLSQDHLDYHHSMEEYFQAKLKLFTDYTADVAVINMDDPYGRQIINALPDADKIVVYGCDIAVPQQAYVLARDVRETRDGVRFQLVSSWGEFVIHSRLYGKYNVYNLLAVAAVLFKLNYAADNVVAILQSIEPVAGRLENYSQVGHPHVFVDFAHTPDALDKTLQALQHSFGVDIYCVFGCGGDRDREKRPLMGAVASRYCKQVIITDDNPRSEDPAAIAADIVRGIVPGTDYIVEHDRRKAITLAIETAAEGDVVLIAGKGHETTQTIGNQVLPFSDSDVVKEVLAA